MRRPARHQRNRLRNGLAAVALLLGTTLATGAAGETIELADGRRYAVHVPDDLSADQPAPLVLVLAGAGGGAADALVAQGWTGTADASGFIAAGLEALPISLDLPPQPLRNRRIWDGRSPAAARHHPVGDDVAHVRAVLDDVAGRHPIDATRIYAVGFADGGAMTQRLAVELGDRLAAVASVGGHLPASPPAQHPLPVLLMFGGADPLVPLDGGQVAAPGLSGARRPPVATTVRRWIERLGCPADPAALVDGPRVERRHWAPCAGGAELAVILVRDLGHHWPGGGGGALPERIAGPTSDAVDATGEIWSFFRSFSRRHRREPAPP